MKHLDLFSGIGGFSLAGSWVWGAEHDIVSFVEIAPFCQRVLKKHWPDVPIISDIRDVTYERVMAYAEEWSTEQSQCNSGQEGGGETQVKPLFGTGDRDGSRGTAERIGKLERGATEISERSPTIDLLTGGFPCQPFSAAGKRRGKEDDRYLWPEMLRVIREIRPTWVIGENVAGIINMELDAVLADLEGAGYEVQPFLIPACGVDAPHRRDRVWIVGHSIKQGLERYGELPKKLDAERKEPGWQPEESHGSVGTAGIFQDVADTSSGGQPRQRKYGESIGQEEGDNGKTDRFVYGSKAGWSNWLPEPDVGRVVDGIPMRVDRLKGLGNAIVPQVVVPIMQAIKEATRSDPPRH